MFTFRRMICTRHKTYLSLQNATSGVYLLCVACPLHHSSTLFHLLLDLDFSGLLHWPGNNLELQIKARQSHTETREKAIQELLHKLKQVVYNIL